MEAFILALVICASCMFYVSGTLVESTVTYEDIECRFANKEYFTVHDVYLTNDGKMAVNFTILKALPIDTHCHAIVWGSSMSEYVVPTGLDIDVELCDMMDEPIILGPALKAFGFNKNECPPIPGNYGCPDYVAPTENFPDVFPSDRYLAVLELTKDGDAMLTIHVTLKV